MSQKKYIVELTQPEIDHLFHLLSDNNSEGTYYGPKDQYWERHKRLMEKLAHAPRKPQERVSYDG